MWDFFASSGAAWLLLLGGFMVVNWLATTAAHDVLDPSRQYPACSALAAAQALIFAPFLYYFFEVQPDGDSTVVAAAAHHGRRVRRRSRPSRSSTRRDLSFLRPLLLWGGVAPLVLDRGRGAVRPRRSASGSRWR